MEKREYKKDSLTVLWDSDLCTHCESCWRELPAVFDPQKRPWVNLDAADADDIRRQVAKCPSGALSLSPGLQELVGYAFSGVGAISPSRYGAVIESIAEMVGRTVDDQFEQEVRDIIGTLPCPMD